MRSADFSVGLRARRVCVALRPGPGTTTTQQVALAVPRSPSPRGQRHNCSRQEDSVQGCAHPSRAVDPKDFFSPTVGSACLLRPASPCVLTRVPPPPPPHIAHCHARRYQWRHGQLDAPRHYPAARAWSPARRRPPGRPDRDCSQGFGCDRGPRGSSPLQSSGPPLPPTGTNLRLPVADSHPTITTSTPSAPLRVAPAQPRTGRLSTTTSNGYSSTSHTVHTRPPLPPQPRVSWRARP